MEKKKKTSIILLGSIIIFLVGYFVLKETYSTSKSINETFISDNIDKINSILDVKYDTTNPYYLTEIVDDNGNVPASKYYSDTYSRGIKALKAYDNKIFMGLGDYDKNTGPVKIIYYNTLTDKIESSGTLYDEEVKEFKIINDKLYTVGTDPRDDWGYGNYYIYNVETNIWDKYMFNDGWIHIFDIEGHNDKIFMCGSILDTMERSLVQVSFDNGKSFEDVKVIYSDGSQVAYDRNLRAYTFFTYKDNLYTQIYLSSSIYNGIYKYDDEKNVFNFVQSYVPISYPFKDENGNNFNTYPFIQNFYYGGTLNFNNNDLYISGQYVYSLHDSNNGQIDFKIIDIPTNYLFQNGVIHDDTLYLLAYYYNPDSSFNTRIYKTKDLKNFDILYEFTTGSLPFSIEYFNNSIYVGTVSVNKMKDISSVGSLYKIDLNKLKRELVLNDDNTITVKAGNVEYDVNYESNPIDISFQTTLSFNDNMSKIEWEKEFNKLKNMNLLYLLSCNRTYINYNSSISYFDNILNNNIIISSVYSSAGEFYNDIFGTGLNIQNKRFSLTSEDISDKVGEYKTKITLIVNNIDDKITSDEYIIDDTYNYVYIGTHNDVDTIKNNINYSDFIDIQVDLNNNKLLIKLEDETIREYSIIRISTDFNVTNEYIYTGHLTEQEILSKINVINGNHSVLNDEILQINYNGVKVDEYKLIRISYSDFTLVSDDKLYVSNKVGDDIISSLYITNSKSFVSGNKITVTSDDEIISEINLLSINLRNLTVKDKNIIIPGNISYDDFIKNISVSDGITFKIMNETSEVTSGNILVGTKLNVYYNDKEVDSFNIIDEYISFNRDINIDTENRILSNISSNKNVSDLLKKINTSGKITIMNNKDEEIINNGLIGTGSRVTVNLSKGVHDYLLMVKGDINGDGLLSLDDINTIANYLYKNKDSLTGIYLEAADYDNSNSHNLEDIMKVAYKIKNNTVLDTLDTLADKIVTSYNESDAIVEKIVGGITYKLDTKNNLIKDIDGNIRYYGKEPNNYVYFNCDEYPDNTCEVWRIIGVFNGKVKLIRNSSLGKFAFDFDYNNDLISKTYNNSWHNSSIKDLLNGAYLNNQDTTYYNFDYNTEIISSIPLNFKTDRTGIKSSTIDSISDFRYNASTWYYNDKFMYADDIYNYEKGFNVYDRLYYNTTWTGKVAFANTSDYMYSADFTKCNLSYYEYDNSICGEVNWLRPVLGVDFAGWSINSITIKDTHLFAFYQVTGGYATARATSQLYVVPVLHLKEDTKVITEGNGSAEKPYKLFLD